MWIAWPVNCCNTKVQQVHRREHGDWAKMMMMMTLGGAVCPVRNKTDNSCHRNGSLTVASFKADASTQELSARKLWAYRLWNMESSRRAQTCPPAERPSGAVTECPQASCLACKGYGHLPIYGAAPSRDSCWLQLSAKSMLTGSSRARSISIRSCRQSSSSSSVMPSSSAMFKTWHSMKSSFPSPRIHVRCTRSLSLMHGRACS